jgi:hypothetical protein
MKSITRRSVLGGFAAIPAAAAPGSALALPEAPNYFPDDDDGPAGLPAFRGRGIYEVRHPSGNRIVIADELRDLVWPQCGDCMVRVSFSLDERAGGGTYRQRLSKFERRIVRRLVGF